MGSRGQGSLILADIIIFYQVLAHQRRQQRCPVEYFVAAEGVGAALVNVRVYANTFPGLPVPSTGFGSFAARK